MVHLVRPRKAVDRSATTSCIASLPPQASTCDGLWPAGDALPTLSRAANMSRPATNRQDRPIKNPWTKSLLSSPVVLRLLPARRQGPALPAETVPNNHSPPALDLEYPLFYYRGFQPMMAEGNVQGLVTELRPAAR